MDLTTFSRDVVPIAQLAVAVLGLISLLLVWYQIRQAAQWNKLSTHHALLGYLPGEETEKAVLDLLDQYKSPRDSPIARGTAEQIYSDTTAFVTLKTFLNKFEHFCAAINAGAIDEEHAYAVHSGRVIYVHQTFRSFIELARDKRGAKTYIEIERVSVRWNDRRLREDTRLAEELRRLQQRDGVVRRRV